MSEPTFHLTVRSREGKVYEADVVSLSSYNEQGKFDILGQHANFISLITAELAITEADGSEKSINIDNALLRVREGRVEVFVGVEGMRRT